MNGAAANPQNILECELSILHRADTPALFTLYPGCLAGTRHIVGAQ